MGMDVAPHVQIRHLPHVLLPLLTYILQLMFVSQHAQTSIIINLQILLAWDAFMHAKLAQTIINVQVVHQLAIGH